MFVNLVCPPLTGHGIGAKKYNTPLVFCPLCPIFPLKLNSPALIYEKGFTSCTVFVPHASAPGLIIISTSRGAESRNVDSLDTGQMPVRANQLSTQGNYWEQL